MITNKQSLSTLEYNDALRLIRSIQLIIGIFTISFMITLSPIRAQIEAKNPLETLLFVLFEFVIWLSITERNGIVALPANYISLLLMKCFIFYDTQFKGKLRLSKATWFEALLSYNFRSAAKTTMKNAFAWEKTLTLYCALIIIPAATLLTNMYIGDYEVSSLVVMTMSTTWAMGILVSAMAGMELVGETLHFRICAAWAYFTSIVTFFSLLFIVQRSWRYSNGRLSRVEYSRTTLEMCVYLLSTYLMMQYIPIIHTGFDFEDVITWDARHLLKKITPSTLKYMIQNLNLSEIRVFDHFRWFFPASDNDP